ncbi:unnamed protein product, partial [Symbiodinium sp. CCMP2592]
VDDSDDNFNQFTRRDSSWARGLLAKAVPPLNHIVLDDAFLDALCSQPLHMQVLQPQTQLQRFEHRLASLSDAALTQIMRRQLNLAALQDQLKAARGTTKKRSIRKLIKRAKLSDIFWSFNASQRQGLLRDAGVYIFETPTTEPEELPTPPPSDTPRPRPSQRRRCCRKETPSDALWQGWEAVRLARCESSHLSRDLCSDIWSTSWGTRKVKPCALFRWSEEHPLQPAWVQLLFSKPEKGKCYYSEKALFDSPVVREMSRHYSMQDVYNRLPLLATPSKTYELGSEDTVCVVDDVVNAAGKNVTDGFAEISLDFALKHGLVTKEQVEQGIYHAIQFRGLFRDIASGEILLAKGMLAVRKGLQRALCLRPKCIKMRFNPTADFAAACTPGIDVVQTTAAAQGAPKLNAQLCAALGLRTCLIRGRAERLEARAELRSFCRARRQETLGDIEASSWGFSPPTKPSNPGATAKPLLQQTRAPPDAPQAPHAVPFHRVKLTYVERVERPTPMQELAAEAELVRPWCLPELGTKDALLRGGRRFNKSIARQNNKPQLSLRGHGGACFALPDLWGNLGPQCCHIICQGRVLKGTFAVWRNPCMLPSDVEVWEAIDLPANADLVPDNCIICSVIGDGVVALAGGDYDGDVVFFTADFDLLEFLANTPSGVDNPQLRAVEEAVGAALVQEAPVQEYTPLDFLKYCATVPTLETRGYTCANAERAQLVAWKSRKPLRSGSLQRAVELGHIAHKAYDAPKSIRRGP